MDMYSATLRVAGLPGVAAGAPWLAPPGIAPPAALPHRDQPAAPPAPGIGLQQGRPYASGAAVLTLAGADDRFSVLRTADALSIPGIPAAPLLPADPGRPACAGRGSRTARFDRPRGPVEAGPVRARAWLIAWSARPGRSARRIKLTDVERAGPGSRRRKRSVTARAIIHGTAWWSAVRGLTPGQCVRVAPQYVCQSAVLGPSRRATAAGRRLGKLTTIASCVLRAMTTTASTSGSGFSSRWGTHGGT
jgi:hypothetical protein